MSDTDVHIDGDWATVTVLDPAALPEVAEKLLAASDATGGVTTITGTAIAFRAPTGVVEAAGLLDASAADPDPAPEPDPESEPEADPEPESEPEPEPTPKKTATRRTAKKTAPAAPTVTTTNTSSEETHP